MLASSIASGDGIIIITAKTVAQIRQQSTHYELLADARDARHLCEYATVFMVQFQELQ